MNTFRAAPKCPTITKEFLKYSFLCVSTLSLSGCITTDHSAPLAPPPEKISSPYNQDFAVAKTENAQNADLAAEKDVAVSSQDLHLSPMLQNLMAQGVVRHSSVMAETGDALSLNGSKKEKSNCRWKDRLDRDAVVAYEWSRNRLSMDVDGVNMSGDGEYGVYVEYRLRFQPEKKKKERCRYKSAWQGMVGTGYHEFFVREEDTVWQGIKEDVKGIQKKVTNVTDRFF